MDYNIVFVTDANYLQHLCVTLVSLLENNKGKHFKVYILSNKMPASEYRKIETMAGPYSCELENIVVDDKIVEGLILSDHFTKAAYYKLLIPDSIREEKVLYFDSDLIVNGPISGIYDVDLGDFYLGAVESPIFNSHKELKMDINSKGFNSGVMLMNLNKWREGNISKKVIDFVRNNSSVIKSVDNCGLNSVINGNFMKFGPKYNLSEDLLDKTISVNYSVFTKEVLEDAQVNPVIIHYTGSLKPWQYLCQHPYKNLYWEYLRKTPFKEYRISGFTFKNVIEKNLPEGFKKPLKKIWNKCRHR